MDKQHILGLPIYEMKISTRAKNVLIRGGCKNVQDVVNLGYRRCHVLRNCGRITVDEIFAAIRAMGFTWPDYIPKSDPITVDSNYRCSHCKSDISEFVLCDANYRMKFCPICGRKFHEKEEE